MCGVLPLKIFFLSIAKIKTSVACYFINSLHIHKKKNAILIGISLLLTKETQPHL